MWVTRETSCLWWYLSVSYKTAVTVLLSRLVCFVCFQIATVMTPLSWLNKANLSVCPSVFSSMKSFFFRFECNLVFRCGTMTARRWYAVWKFKGQSHRGPKVEKWPISVCLLHQYACNQKTNSELSYSKTVSRLCRDRFLRFVLVLRHMTCKVRLLWGVDWQTCMGLFFNFKTIRR